MCDSKCKVCNCVERAALCDDSPIRPDDVPTRPDPLDPIAVYRGRYGVHRRAPAKPASQPADKPGEGEIDAGPGGLKVKA